MIGKLGNLFRKKAPEAPAAEAPKDAERKLTCKGCGKQFAPDPSLGFCPTCGSPLVNEPAESSSAGAAFAEEPEAPAAYAEPPRVASVRKCSGGYLCDDPDLNFCPACGLPLDAASSAAEDGWTCVCGTVNAAGMNYCESCGKPRGWRPEPKPVEPKEEIHIPSGMKPPAEGDLEIKSKYGN